MTQPSRPERASAAEASTAGWSSTGHPRVDDLVVALDTAAGLPPADQIAPLSEADRALRETLDSIGDV